MGIIIIFLSFKTAKISECQGNVIGANNPDYMLDVVGTINSSGDITSSGNITESSFNVTSDLRLKANLLG